MATLREQLTVLVPTCNRQDRLLRLLRYYSASRCPASMQVLDSSTTPIDARAIEPLVARDIAVSVTRYAPTVPALTKMLKGLEMVSTPYVVIWADDDFLIPRAFEEGVRLLNENPQLSLVHGRSGLFRLDIVGSLQWVAPYPQRAILEETASARLRNHFRRYSVTFYSIHRTEALRRNFEQICGLGLDWHTWGELTLSALGVIQGKAHLMDRLYMVREAHMGMGSSVAQAVRGLDPFDWLTDIAFSREHGSYEMFRDCLVPELIRQDQMDTASARDVIKQAFWLYLVERMERKWCSPVARRTSAMAARLRSAATHVPGLRKAWHRAQTFLPGQDRAVTLPALTRFTSRYHRDFMPVVNAIAGADGHNGVGGS